MNEVDALNQDMYFCPKSKWSVCSVGVSEIWPKMKHALEGEKISVVDKETSGLNRNRGKCQTMPG